MKNFLPLLIAFTVFICGFSNLEEKATIYGTLTDELGEAVPFASVALYQNDNLIRGAETDLDGKYKIGQLKAGVFDVEFSYVGYAIQRVEGVILKEDEQKKVNATMTEGVSLDEILVIDHCVPLIRVDETSTGGILRGDDIKNLPIKEIGGLIGTTSGVATSGSDVQIKGSRADKTVYYLDGEGVDGTIPPQTSMRNNNDIVLAKKDRSKVLDRSRHEPVSTEKYEAIAENLFIKASDENTSTFSIDVDAASYANMRRFINNNQMPPVDAVRIEEMINYFNYDYPTPYKEPFEIITEVGNCPWNAGHQLVHIGLQGMKIDKEQLPPSNLVFLIDVSGSMRSKNKLGLLKKGFNLLIDELRSEDKISIVTYAGSAGIVLPPTNGNNKAAIRQAINNLRSGGSTAGAQGIITAYDLARKQFLKNGNNRVILATDGDFNVGISDDESLVKLIEKERESDIFLSVLGFGMGNYQDGKMQKLADSGNGNHAYIDNIHEANKVFVSEFGGTLFTIAKDVKIQIEFDKNQVAAYRLIGYENRVLANRDFADDTKDAGELGAGHTVTALYEIIPTGYKSDYLSDQDGNLSKAKESKAGGKLIDVRFRYKKPKGKKSKLITRSLSLSNKTFAECSENFKWSASVAEFGLLLRNSKFKGNASYAHVLTTAESAKGMDENGYRGEFVQLVKTVSAVASK